MSVVRRIYSSIAASAFGQLVTIGSQLLLTPLFFSIWGAEKYGEWLLLSSIPAYLTMLDLGIGAAAANEMGMNAARQQYSTAKTIFHGAIVIAAAASTTVLLLSVAAGFALTYTSVFHFAHIQIKDLMPITLLLGASIGIGFFNGLAVGGFRAAEMNATAIFLSNVTRLFEAIATGLLVWQGSGPLQVCISFVVIRLLMLLIQTAHLQQQCRWLFSGGWSPNMAHIRSLIVPSIGFIFLPLGHALAIQGPVLVIGLTLGSASVAIFSALRTITRIPLQVANVLNHSIWPEMTRAFGANNLSLFRTLHRASWSLALASSVAVWLILALFARELIGFWLHKEIAFEFHLLMVLCATATLSALWAASQVALSSTNRHVSLTTRLVAINAVGLALMYPAAKSYGWPAVEIILIAIDMSVLTIAMAGAMAISDDTLWTFLRAAITDTVTTLRKQLVSRLKLRHQPKPH